MTHQVESGAPLQDAHRMQERVSRVGFDWAEPMGAWRKVAEELDEVRVELEALAKASDDSRAGGEAGVGASPEAIDDAEAGGDVGASGDASVSDAGEPMDDSRTGGDVDAIRRRLGEELGDLLFSVVNLARLTGDHAHPLLEAANRKFANRFRRLEALAEEREIAVGEASLEVLDSLWEELKAPAPGEGAGGEDDEKPGKG